MKANPVFSAQSADVLAERDIHPLAATGELDKKRERRRTLVILLVAALARLPFLWHGFGGHPDEWYTIGSGLDFWLHGTYYPSRPAGYPLNEIMMGGLAWLGGAPACAIASMLASLATLAYLRALSPLYGIRDSFWMVLALSFEPWFWSSGTHCLDYIWGTGSLVTASYYVERRQLPAAGLACAVGFGFRPTSLLWIGPLLLRVGFIERHWQGVLQFALWVAIPALFPTLIIAAAVASNPEAAWAGAGESLSYVSKAFRYPVVAPIIALYHLVELMGHLPAVLLIAAACYTNCDRLSGLFRSGEGWVWTYALIFALLFAVFVNHSDKPEYMLPALPGLFLVLGRCISDNWWKAITAAFAFNAFVSFGFGHAPAWGQSIDLARPSLRAGALVWYADRAKADNEAVLRVGSGLSEPAKIIRADRDNLAPFYVSSLLTHGLPSQARLSCPLIKGILSFPKDAPPKLTPTIGAGMYLYRSTEYPMLTCCSSMSAVLPASAPLSNEGELKGVLRGFCMSKARRGTASNLP